MNPLYPLSSFVDKRNEEHQEPHQDPNLKLYIFSPSPSKKLAFATRFNTTDTQHGHQSVNLQEPHHPNNGVRVCSDCNTTTPLWRSGPQGPKSLCNACGIRQRKARRAMVEAANGDAGAVVASEAASGTEVHKEKKSRLSCHGDAGIVAHVKKKCRNHEIKDHNSNLESHRFTLHLSKRSGSSFGRVFPRDGEEAAILLMELLVAFFVAAEFHSSVLVEDFAAF